MVESMIRRVLATFTFSLLTCAGADCLTGPVEVLFKPASIARMETRVITDAKQPQATEVKVTTFRDGKVVSEETYPLNNPSDRTTWTYQYQGGRLEKMTGRAEGTVPSLNVLTAATERTFRYNAQGQQGGDITNTVRLGVRLPVSETTCTYSPDGRRVTEIIRTLSGAAIHPALLTEYTLDGQGRVVTVTLKDDLGGKMTETNRLVYVYQPQGGYVRMETETNPFSGEVERKGYCSRNPDRKQLDL